MTYSNGSHYTITRGAMIVYNDSILGFVETAYTTSGSNVSPATESDTATYSYTKSADTLFIASRRVTASHDTALIAGTLINVPVYYYEPYVTGYTKRIHQYRP